MSRLSTPRLPRGAAAACATACACAIASALLLAACSGNTGSERDSGSNKTTLTVAASDADGHPLHYQWRVTGGTVENRDAAQTVWTLPDGPGLHFAYVTISDGQGGYTEQQYAVSSDTLGTTAPLRAAVTNTPPAVADFEGTVARLRFVSPNSFAFAVPGSAANTTAVRTVYVPDVRVQVQTADTAEVVFSGASDLSGEVNLPKLVAGKTYDVRCAAAEGAALAACGQVALGNEAGVVLSARPPPTRRTCVCLAMWRWPMAAPAATKTTISASSLPPACSCCRPMAWPCRSRCASTVLVITRCKPRCP